MRSQTTAISPDFPFESRYLDVHDARIHYYELGEGEPVVFLHGNPTWGYLWRNVVPHVAPYARCIVPDLVGMGRSSKPDIRYRFFEHYAYVAGFIERMELTNVTLVVHDWGSALGFRYWSEMPDNVRGLAFMEAILSPLRWTQFPANFRAGFGLMRTPAIGWLIVSVLNGFVEQILPRAVLRPLCEAEMVYYREPFPTIASRLPVRQWPCEIPIEGRPPDVDAAVAEYNLQLQASDVPKLLLYARPGGIIGPQAVAWCQRRLSNLESADIGSGIHFLQEDNPDRIGMAIADWYVRL